MDRQRSQLTYARSRREGLILCMVVFVLGLCVLGCRLLYDPVPVPPGGDTNAPPQFQPSPKVTVPINDIGHFFGPYGDLIAGALSLALYAGARYKNAQALAEHQRQYHLNPPATGPPS